MHMIVLIVGIVSTTSTASDCCGSPWIPLLGNNDNHSDQHQYGVGFLTGPTIETEKSTENDARNINVDYAPETSLNSRDDGDDDEDGCSRSRILQLDIENSTPTEAVFTCSRVLYREQCAYNHWVTVNKHTRQGECSRQVCPDGLVLLEQDQMCYDPTEPSLCPPGMTLFMTAFGDVTCHCSPGYYPDQAGQCRQLLSNCPQENSKRLQLLGPDSQGQLFCGPRVCPERLPVPYNGQCSRLGEPCAGPKTILVLDTTSQQIECVTIEEFSEDQVRPRDHVKSNTSSLVEQFMIQFAENSNLNQSQYSLQHQGQSDHPSSSQPSSTNPSEHLPPSSFSNPSEYLPPSSSNPSEYLPPSSSNPSEYLPPPSSSNPSEYLPPPSSNPAEYLPPSSPTNPSEYLPPSADNNNLPPNNLNIPQKLLLETAQGHLQDTLTTVTDQDATISGAETRRVKDRLSETRIRRSILGSPLRPSSPLKPCTKADFKCRQFVIGNSDDRLPRKPPNFSCPETRPDLAESAAMVSTMKVVVDRRHVPYAVLLMTYRLQQSGITVSLEWSDRSSTSLTIVDSRGANIVLETNVTICRHLARQLPCLYGNGDHLLMAAADSWLSVGQQLETAADCCKLLHRLDAALLPASFLVGESVSVADFVVWGALRAHPDAHGRLTGQVREFPNVKRWYALIASQDAAREMESSSSSIASVNGGSVGGSVKPSAPKTVSKEEGKFVDLPGAEMGKVVVRFPPEASGYLHIGHAKAALLNQYYQQAFKGKLIMRFDDTNPQKESAVFEREILKDLELLMVKPDVFTHSSDHFDTMLTMCEQLMKAGKAFVDNTDAETMKNEREQMIESRNRSNSVEKNLSMWRQMVNGTEDGKKCCVRAKINMKSANGCLRDPTIYRCKPEPHVRTGFKYKVYPTYDFCCPIVDSIEGVTHALRTTEYHDRDDQYYWFIEALGLRRPYIYEYSRLNMTNTVLSKRKLTWFVENGLVDGWDDPRFPTVRGILRRGMTVEGLRQFIVAQGSSRAVVFMEWDKIWAFNKKVIDPVAPRYTTVVQEGHVVVHVSGITAESTLTAAKHPKNAEVGTKTVWTGSRLIIDSADVDLLTEGQNATFINWGNMRVDCIERNATGVATVKVTPQLENKDFKKTAKLTWLADTARAPFIPVVCVYFDHIISKAVLAKDEDFKQFIPANTRREIAMLGDPELANVRKSEIIQIQRRGFFICDSPYRRGSAHSFCESPCVLIYIPDGHSKSPLPAPSVQQVSPRKIAENNSKTSSAPGESSAPSSDALALFNKVTAQGDKVRQLKSKKAEKSDIDREVKLLLSLKSDYKTATGSEYKPGCPPEVPSVGSTESPSALNEKIAEQGDKVRRLKAAKAEKLAVDAEVKILLALKQQFKVLTGSDWKPGVQTPAATSGGETATHLSADALNKQIKDQGDRVRQLKSEKVDKKTIEGEVQKLLALKSSYKSVTGADWKPTAHVNSTAASNEAGVGGAGSASDPPSSSSLQLDQAIKEQGDKIRRMKAEKKDKSALQPEIDRLLSLKSQFKSAAGCDWSPQLKLDGQNPSRSDNATTGALLDKIEAQASRVRQLKADKAEKSVIDEQVKLLLQLKQEYKSLTGQDPPSSGAKPASAVKSDDSKSASSKPPEKKSKKSSKTAASGTGDGGSSKKPSGASNEDNTLKKQTRLGLEARKEDSLSDWYSQVITKAELIEYYDVSGCYILRPWAFAMWDIIKDFFDGRIKQLGVQNCYFPMFVSKAALEKEKDHISDFSPEVAWVTKSGDSELSEAIAIRPTSETVMYPTYARWIQSHRDLPLRLNQWNNVVRWEFKHPQPFLRTREFLWQEGHTAFASKDEADAEVLQILDLYRQIYEDLLAVPVVPGRKTEKEKFAGGDYTTTVEAFIAASGRAIQGATSHHLGQNFSRMFDIGFEHPETQQRSLVFQNSWGITTRTLGVVVMVHGDNQGLVLPPRISATQVVVVPCGITASLSSEEKDALLSWCSDIQRRLSSAGVRCHADVRDNYSPGWKFNHWELKGVPVRLELGPRDLKKQQVVMVRRDSGEKSSCQLQQLEDSCQQLLQLIQQQMLQRARDQLRQSTMLCDDFDAFCRHLDNRCLILAPFCGRIECEDRIKKDSARDEDVEPGAPAMGAKGLCIPFEQPVRSTQEHKSKFWRCIHPSCDTAAANYTLFGRSY